MTIIFILEFRQIRSERLGNFSGACLCDLLISGLIVFCIAFGSTIGSMGTPADPLKHFFSALDSVIMKLVGIVMWLVSETCCGHNSSQKN